MIAILFATHQEARPFLKQYERGRFDGLHEGETVSDDHILVSVIGVGKIKAALRTERLLQSEKIDQLLHPGTCTSLNADFGLGRLVGTSQVFEGDRIELSAPTYPRLPLEIPVESMPSGTLVTQDHIPSEASEQSYWQRIADFSDMTGYAVAYVTATYGIPCYIVKVVTGMMYAQNDNLQRTLDRAYETLATFLLEYLATPVKS
jgi:nucleoside phosphorylase